MQGHATSQQHVGLCGPCACLCYTFVEVQVSLSQTFPALEAELLGGKATFQ